MATQSQSLFQPALVAEATKQAFVKLDPRIMFRNPVMFTVELGTVVMLLVTIGQLVRPDASQGSFGYNLTVFIVLYSSRSYSPILPRPSPRHAARPRPTHCAKPARIRPPRCASPMAASRA